MKITRKVLISIRDSEEDFFAEVFLKEGERVQDVLNDDRKFLPVRRHMQRRSNYSADVWIDTCIHKDTIGSVEER